MGHQKRVRAGRKTVISRFTDIPDDFSIEGIDKEAAIKILSTDIEVGILHFNAGSPLPVEGELQSDGLRDLLESKARQRQREVVKALEFLKADSRAIETCKESRFLLPCQKKAMFKCIDWLILISLSSLVYQDYIFLDDVDDPKRMPFVNETQNSTEQIGEWLNQLGGLAAMKSAYSLVPSFDQGKLNAAWDGIGQWVS